MLKALRDWGAVLLTVNCDDQLQYIIVPSQFTIKITIDIISFKKGRKYILFVGPVLDS